MSLAITREISASIIDCELTHLDRSPIDLERARAQHAAYGALLAKLGAQVIQLPELASCPDAVFVEDTALVLPELAVLTRPGAASRRPEVASIAEELGKHRELAWIQEDSLDGGDVLVQGKRIFVGLSGRSTPAAIAELGALLEPHGYRVEGLRISGCLHLKSAVCALDAETLLINPDWVEARHFPQARLLSIEPGEAFGANAFSLGGQVVHPEEFHGTRARIEAAGFQVAPIAADELAKAEGGVTCCSLIL